MNLEDKIDLLLSQQKENPKTDTKISDAILKGAVGIMAAAIVWLFSSVSENTKAQAQFKTQYQIEGTYVKEALDKINNLATKQDIEAAIKPTKEIADKNATRLDVRTDFMTQTEKRLTDLEYNFKSINTTLEKILIKVDKK